MFALSRKQMKKKIVLRLVSLAFKYFYRMDLAFSGWQFHTIYWKYCRVQINFSKLYCEKLYGKNLLVLVSPEWPLWLSLMGRTFCNFAYFRLLEKTVSNKIKLLKVTSATQLFFVIKQRLMCNWWIFLFEEKIMFLISLKIRHF